MVWCEDTWQRPSGSTRGVLIRQSAFSPAKTVFFLHGLGNDAFYSHVGIFRHLLAQGWNIATCDIDGHGIGNTSLFDADTTLSCPDSLIQFMESLIPGRHRLHLAGYSLGAALMLHFAIHHPERIASLALISLPALIPERPSVWSEVRALGGASFRSCVSDYGLYHVFPAVGPFKRHSYPIRFNHTKDASATTITGNILKRIQVEHALQVASFPTLFLTGDYDSVAPVSLAQNLNLPLERLQIYCAIGESHLTTLFSPKIWKRYEVFLRALASQE